ncbi:MAG TPA: helix-turn-helix domain-containing protein [Candidatus Dormibacteraeota bacterium]
MTEDAYRTPAEMGAVVAELRRQAGLDEAAVAARLAIDPDDVDRIERGERRLNAWELYALAELLRVEPGLIVTREQPGPVLLRTGGAGETALRHGLSTFEMVVREVLAARALEELL